MRSVDEALRLVLEQCSPNTPTHVPLSEAVGLVLAEDVENDIDSPPHDKSLVDGFAVRTAELTPGTKLDVIEEIAAGDIPRLPVSSGQATRIMTGAPIPQGADAVVMVERTSGVQGTSFSASQIRIDEPPRAGFGILKQGMSMRRGQVVLSEGKVLRAVEIGLLAEAGKAQVLAHPRPRVAVLTTATAGRS